MAADTAKQTVGGYRLRRRLHAAQYTEVYEVVEAASGRHLAMKRLLPAHAADKGQRAMLFHEAVVGLAMRHDNVIPILKVHKGADDPFLIMEYFPAGSLKARLNSKDPADKRYLADQARNLFRQAAIGLAYMNTSGWLHCDVKPDNILADAAGRVKLIDFAICARPKTGWLARTLHRPGKPRGTPSYMSPEQIRDDPLDTRADVYSYGATVYELAAGRPPFRANSPKELLEKNLYATPDPPSAHNPAVAPEFDRFVLGLLAKKREDRPATFHDVLMQLQKLPVFAGERRA